MSTRRHHAPCLRRRSGLTALVMHVKSTWRLHVPHPGLRPRRELGPWTDGAHHGPSILSTCWLRARITREVYRPLPLRVSLAGVAPSVGVSRTGAGDTCGGVGAAWFRTCDAARSSMPRRLRPLEMHGKSSGDSRPVSRGRSAVYGRSPLLGSATVESGAGPTVPRLAE